MVICHRPYGPCTLWARSFIGGNSASGGSAPGSPSTLPRVYVATISFISVCVCVRLCSDVDLCALIRVNVSHRDHSNGCSASGSSNNLITTPAVATLLQIDDTRFELDCANVTDLTSAASRLDIYRAELARLVSRSSLIPSPPTPQLSLSSSPTTSTLAFAAGVDVCAAANDVHIMKYLFAVKLSLWELARQLKAPEIAWDRTNEPACELVAACADLFQEMQSRLRILAPPVLALVTV